MNERYIRLGFHPYGLNVSQIDMVVDDDNVFWREVRARKKALDPDGIIAPGRYGLV